MSSDEWALLAAVRDAPADDLPRLVYADWLDENGHPARAEFIRLQVEAERLHPDSARRAALTSQAEALLAAHWLDWWGEVCGAVGLPLPERPPPPARRGWLARLVRRPVEDDPPGYPYGSTGTAVGRRHRRRSGPDGPPPDGFAHAVFRRGFPDHLWVSGHEPPGNPGPLLGRWAAAGPLAAVDAGSRWWPGLDGPHLAGVGRLTLSHPTADALRTLLASPHLTDLTDLRLRADEPLATLGPELVAVVFSPAAERLRRLEVPLPDQTSAGVLAATRRPAGLTGLDVKLEYEPAFAVTPPPVAPEVDRGRLERLARSPYLAGLTELHVSGVLSAAGVRALVHRPAWAGLRTLALNHLTDADYLGGLADAAGLDDLIDLRVAGLLSDDELRLVARLPVLRQLRHLSVWPPHDAEAADVLALADALDPGRLETLSFGGYFPPNPLRAELLRRFDDRIRGWRGRA